MALTCRSPVLSIDCHLNSNKWSRASNEDDENGYVYQTPLPASSSPWNKRPRDARCLSPPQTPRGKRAASRHVFVFDTVSSQDAELLLPDLVVPIHSRPLEPIRLHYHPQAESIVPVPPPVFNNSENDDRMMLWLPALQEGNEDSDLMPPPVNRPPTTEAITTTATSPNFTTSKVKPDPHDAVLRESCWTPNLPQRPTSSWNGTEYAPCA